MQIQLRWTDPSTGNALQPQLETPVALGREFALMPGVLNGERVSRIVITDAGVEPYHALLVEQNGELIVTAQAGEIRVNGVNLPSSTLFEGDRLQIGSVTLQVSLAGVPAGAADAGALAQANLQPGLTAVGCNRRVGFLFQRRCGRTDPTGCPYCNGGQLEQDPYFYDRSLYPHYGDYSHDHWGGGYYANRDAYVYDPETYSVDFTEADSAPFESVADQDYEQNMGAS